MHAWRNNTATDRPLVSGDSVSWHTPELEQRIAQIEKVLRARSQPQAAVGILADNCPDWIAIDLAAHQTGVPLVPLPSFFTPAQWLHAIEATGVQALFCMSKEHAENLGFERPFPFNGGLLLYERPNAPACELAGIQKITFTSGTTSQPKGVCLSSAQQWELASVLTHLLAGLDIRRHLNLLPLPVLLENIAGVYTALLSNATNIVLPLAQTGLSGASHFDPVVCLDTIGRQKAESIIILPQMLHSLVQAAERNDSRIKKLKFVAVGGAKTPNTLLLAARDKGFPVYEGYGLSECGSVVSLNLPGADRPSSVGRALPNRQVRIAADGEIEVGGGGMVGYLGNPHQDDWLPTGDLGYLDADGFLYVEGRKKNVLVTSFGRNISPEWPEATLVGTGALAQVMVFGDACPYLIAAVVPAYPGMTNAQIQAAIDQANRSLPDFARVRRWFRTTPFTTQDGTATANGRARRDAVAARCHQDITQAYQTIGD